MSAGAPGAAYCGGSAYGGRLALGGTRRPGLERLLRAAAPVTRATVDFSLGASRVCPRTGPPPGNAGASELQGDLSL